MAFRKQVYFKDSEMLELIEQFLDNQKSFSDSIMYLIEQEIAKHGIRNLGNFIPQERSKEYWDSALKENLLGGVSRPFTAPEPVSNDSAVSVSSVPVNPFRAEIKEADTVDIPSCYE